MATTTGTIRDIQVTEDLCCVTVNKSGGGTAQLLLWTYTSQDDNAKNRFTHGMFLSIARDAYIHNKTAIFLHPNGSALITSIETT